MRETFIRAIGFSEEFISYNRSGWGCGYVFIPKEHPILVNLLVNDPKGYLTPKDCEQDITFSQWDGSDEDYYVIGFDTAHAYNNAEHDESYVIKEANKIKQLVDKFTLEEAYSIAKTKLEELNITIKQLQL